jgi:hypothetical protein
MPPRPRHIPHNIERTALQKMSATQGLTLAQLHPAGEKTIAGMVAKDTQRGRGNGILIRPISARYMHKKEVENYEKNYPDV